jgi:hypothetical protein
LVIELQIGDNFMGVNWSFPYDFYRLIASHKPIYVLSRLLTLVDLLKKFFLSSRDFRQPDGPNKLDLLQVWSTVNSFYCWLQHLSQLFWLILHLHPMVHRKQKAAKVSHIMLPLISSAEKVRNQVSRCVWAGHAVISHGNAFIATNSTWIIQVSRRAGIDLNNWNPTSTLEKQINKLLSLL